MTIVLVLVLCVGCVLYRLGGTRSSRLIQGDLVSVRQRAHELSPRVCLELVATILDAGLPLTEAVGIVARIEGSPAFVSAAERLRLGISWDNAWSVVGTGRATETAAVLREVLGFAVRTGAPSSSLLRARAGQMRRSEHREAEKLAAALGVRLVLPLGLCSLPAFICLGVIPVLIGLMPTTWR
ncbi:MULTISPECIES: type II secretion system F family protein [Micrococcaceae]|uniref:type II secretion system F family protein n=1 Tax=unclassified Kocuria TaxID=2649579 RepID=UPI001EE03113|nr:MULTISPECIES: type II secretion system F family protein [unclassified Kocuria]